MGNPQKSSRAIEVFFSYSHRDEEMRYELEKHLGILKHRGLISAWHDRKIDAGEEWKGEIDEHLNSAQIILLLISADFLASEYCYDIEMKRAMERHESGEARVIPIILRHVLWKGSPFYKLQSLPTNAEPIKDGKWRSVDEAFADVAKGIEETIADMKAAHEQISGHLCTDTQKDLAGGNNAQARRSAPIPSPELSKGPSQREYQYYIDLVKYALKKQYSRLTPSKKNQPIEVEETIHKDVKDLWEKLPTGRIIFNPPSKMRVAMTERIEARIATQITRELEIGLKGKGEIQSEDLKVSASMIVELKGEKFKIDPLFNNKKNGNCAGICTMGMGCHTIRKWPTKAHFMRRCCA